jgi:hypothetical protein
MVDTDAVTNVTLASSRAGTLRIVPRDEDRRGPEAMLDLRSRSSIKDIRATLAGFAALVGDDRRTNELRAATGGRLDLSLPAHRDALLAWLRQWGCRHLRTADNARSSRALLAWWKRHASDIPASGATLHRLGPAAFAKAGRAHADLAARPAARRRHGDGEVDVTFGSTAAAKAMFALRPQVFPPWDEPMRSAFSWTGLDPSDYEAFLYMSKDALEGLARRAGVPVSRLPEHLGRPDSTPARIVDEYLWMRLTRGA